MRLPRFRFTVRRMMVAVVFVGLGLGGVAWVGRERLIVTSWKYHEKAVHHAEQEQAYRDEATIFPFHDSAYAEKVGRPQSSGVERAKRTQAMVAYHRSMRIKYERAARYPWFPVEPDPPPPP